MHDYSESSPIKFNRNEACSLRCCVTRIAWHPKTLGACGYYQSSNKEAWLTQSCDTVATHNMDSSYIDKQAALILHLSKYIRITFKYPLAISMLCVKSAFLTWVVPIWTILSGMTRVCVTHWKATVCAMVFLFLCNEQNNALGGLLLLLCSTVLPTSGFMDITIDRVEIFQCSCFIAFSMKLCIKWWLQS